MGKCLKGKSTVKKSDAKVKCERCGALADKKKNVCCAEKITPKTTKKAPDSKKKVK